MMQSSAAHPVVEIEGLCKSFGKTLIHDHLSL